MADRIAIASDHAAFELKAQLTEHLRAAGHDVLDLGPEGADPVDYPDYGYKLAAAIAAGEATRGIAICGSGIGISIAVNRNPAARAGSTTPLSDVRTMKYESFTIRATASSLRSPWRARGHWYRQEPH